MYKSNKIKDLEKKITNIRNNELNKHRFTNSKVHKKNDFKIAMNCMLELISGFLSGGCIGYFLDKLFDTNFIFFIVFIVLGFIAGLRNLIKFLKGL